MTRHPRESNLTFQQWVWGQSSSERTHEHDSRTGGRRNDPRRRRRVHGQLNDDLSLFPDSNVSKGMISNSNDGHDASTEEAGQGAAEGKSATPAVLVENRATYAKNLSDDGVQRE